MKRIRLLVAISAAVFGQMVVQAQLITGAIGFTGQVTINSNSAGTATAVTSWINTEVNGTSGTFANAPYAIPNNTPAAFTSQIWNFNITTPITNFLNVDSFKFELLSDAINYQGAPTIIFNFGENGYIAADGWGILSGNGFTPTVGHWSF